jgi:hypothetical protein
MTNEVAQQPRIVVGFAAQLAEIFAGMHDAGENPEGRNREYMRSVRSSFALLRALGFRIRHPQSLRTKHLEALAREWQSKACAAATLRVRVAALRCFCHGMGKPGLVKDELFFSATSQLTPALTFAAQATPTVAPERRLRSAEAAEARFAVNQKIDVIYAHLVWLQDRTLADRADCLRSTGEQIRSRRWPCVEGKGVRLREMHLAPDDTNHAIAIESLVIATHGSAGRCLSWSGGPYARQRCPKLASDQRRWKYLAKRAAAAQRAQGDYVSNGQQVDDRL